MTKPTASGSQFVGAVSATATDASHTGTGSTCLPTIPIFLKHHSRFTNSSTL